MKVVVFGLTISSSWGNGHATLWRGLASAPAEGGHPPAVGQRGPGGPPPGAAARRVPRRPLVPRHLRREPPGRARGAVRRAGAPPPGPAVRPRRRAVRPRVPVAAEPLLREPPPSLGPRGVPLLVAAHAERHARA